MCKRVVGEDGSVTIVCGGHGRTGRLQTCARCKRPAEVLCDAPGTPGLGAYQHDDPEGRCSTPLCREHAFAGEGEDVHLCFHHRKWTADVGDQASGK